MSDLQLGVADRGYDLVGHIALDHRGRVGLITGRDKTCAGASMWKGLTIDQRGQEGHWRWTSVSPVVIALNLREYAEATDELLGLG